ncbi:hypothetical protein [Phormidium sp. FACHB-1136]|uniref:hypothetical protein n=1 Tax=Phormidium sp. FACHB-1136 TaxID=2692848 RepID=UPI0018F00A99|nr:hypothetical protein [Phormidium sp. FACHB-1136]
MGLFTPQVWLNFLSLLPATTLAVLTLAIAFLRFYDVQDFPLLGFIDQPRLWSNRFTVAALLATLVNFGVEWNRRNCLKTRFANEKQTAWLKQENARLDEIAKQRKERQRRVNEKLDEIDAKYDALRRKSGINSTPPTTTDKN